MSDSGILERIVREMCALAGEIEYSEDATDFEDGMLLVANQVIRIYGEAISQ